MPDASCEWGSRMRKGMIASVAVVVAAIAALATGAAQATTLTINPVSPTGATSFPFGKGVTWPQMGFVYKNIPAFSLKAGGHVAVDLGPPNDANIQLQIDMSATTVNGGDVPAGYTTIVPATQVPANPTGNAVNGDYELEFTSGSSVNFAGGGLIIRFSFPGGAFTADASDTMTMTNVAQSTDPPGFFVKRFFGDGDGLPPYDNVDDTLIAGFRITTLDPTVTPPGAATPLPPLGPKKKCKKKKRPR